MASYGYTFQSGDGVTPTRLNAARTVSNIVNADISASAAIAGTKLSPNFGSQNVVTTGSIATGTTTPSAQLQVTKAETTAYNGAATDGQVGAGATALIQQTAGSQTAVAQIVFQPRGSQPFNRIACSGGSAPFMAFTTNNEERLRVTSSGQMLVNTDAALPIGSTGTGVQIAETGLQLSRWNSASAAAPAFIYAGRSKSATIGTNAAVANNDELFRIGCYGADGTTFVEAARISALCDGTPGTNDMPGRLVFSTTADGSASPTERMRITNEGYLLFGTTSSSGAGGISVYPDNDDGAATMVWNRDTTTASSSVLIFRNAGAAAGSISHTNNATSFNTSSDYRLKDNPTPLIGGLATIDQLQPCEFTWKSDGSIGRGFIAHELQAVVPEAVTGKKDAVDANGDPEYQGVDAAKLVPYLVSAVQELKARVEALEAAQ